ncbi:hypothetical protein [Catenulispora acidiphila]|uniref:hypothetical protein n=1 Tax=Catenulispora acidiphila TaxID=304895 RepID=UPI00117E6F11|nr:hypothetical protein [Catenulispora acidiphila]
MPFRRRRHHPTSPVAIAEQRIAAPLARLEERLVGVSSNLDSLVTGLEDVALQIRQMAEQAAERTGECND